jgi:hypothetical protein
MLFLYEHMLSIPLKLDGIHPKAFFLGNFKNLSLYISLQLFFGMGFIL